MTQPLLGLTAHARATPGKAALILDGVVTTFAALDERSTRVAHGLRARGVTPGDRVAVMLPNETDWFVATAAIGKIDAVMVPVNTHLKDDEVAWIVEDSGARILLTPDQPLPESDGPPLEAAASASPMFYTSGTTGRPKGVFHGGLDRDRMALAQQGQMALWWWSADDVYILSGPAYHAGPGGWAMTALFAGATTVVMRHFDAREWLRLVGAHRVTRSFMVPAHFIRILEVLRDENRDVFDLSSLSLIVHAAAPCPIDVKRRIIAALAPCEVWELYGMSEGGATRVGPKEWLERPGTVGTPWPGVGVAILDESGNECPSGGDGLIYVTPAGGARFRYHNDPTKTDGAWRGDAFTVGDIGHLDADAYLYVTDRATDMVIKGGVNIYPREIEEVLHEHPAVVDCAVFGIPDDRDGEHLKALVELRHPVNAAELADHVRARLASFKVPSVVEVVAELPRDETGKVRKRLLRDAAWSGHDRRIG